ncbi:hypothetical protein [Planococcus sp. CAU13]|uniref:hypothetical protein n=1 Tax=Planococcus sp. CAU13 TaxID=1541197 RepID=UPI00052FE473|nr:hypothetical protein [Planococcus sp. CAU13]
MGNRIVITDYSEQGKSLYIKLEVFDAGKNTLFAEEVRFLDDMLYGDFLHAERSPLTDNCRKETVDYLKNYFGR